MAGQYLIGIDIGGTKIAALAIDREGRIYARAREPLESSSARAPISQAARLARAAARQAALSWGEIAAVGVVIPGLADPEAGTAWAPNIPGWDHVAVRQPLAEALQAPVFIESDRSGYVLGERWLGAARGVDNVVFLAVGTGIGAGILADGKLYRGAHLLAGAVGWFVLTRIWKKEHRLKGCMEAEAAGPALARRARQLLERGAPSRMRELVDGDLEKITAETVVEAARRGDAPALGIIRAAAHFLGMGVANIISILDPEMVVIGGGLAQAGELLLEPLRRTALERAQPLAAKKVKIEASRLGGDAGAIGAAAIALYHIGA